MISDDIIDSCNRNWATGIGWLAEIAKGGRIVKFPEGNFIVRTGLPDQDFNLAFVFRPPNLSAEVTRSIQHLFIDTKTNFEVVVSPEARDSIVPALHGLNLEFLRKVPGMLLDTLPDSVPARPNGLEIHQVEDTDELFAFAHVMNAGFGATPDSFDLVLEGLKEKWEEYKSNAKGSVFYVGYFEGKPIATSVRFTSDSIAGIYAVSTLKEFRRRGFGEAMVWKAAIDGKLEGCTKSYLQASEMGRPIYEKMGYHVICEYDVWGIKKEN